MKRSLVFSGLALALLSCNKDVPPPPAAPVAAAPATPPPPPAKPPLRIAFSDWPGWTAFEVGIEKGWFKDAGLDVKFD
ncbi:MAG TPA: hypothetical protein VHO67_08305, partial [Polyangia bacterium]|nr:hypothetical protein [Polyangia bacterium]